MYPWPHPVLGVWSMAMVAITPLILKLSLSEVEHANCTLNNGLRPDCLSHTATLTVQCPFNLIPSFQRCYEKRIYGHSYQSLYSAIKHVPYQGFMKKPSNLDTGHKWHGMARLPVCSILYFCTLNINVLH